MNLVVCDSEEQVSEQAYRWLERQVAETGARSVFLPAGQTARPLYRLLEARKPDWFRSLALVPVDDVITGPTAGRFAEFFRSELPSFQSQLQPVQKRQQQVDLAVLGLGLNGHVAFHEPHVSRDFEYGEVSLAEQTCAELKVEAGTRGLSYGVATFSRCRAVLMPVIGEKKREILLRVLKGDSTLPAAWLLDRLTLMVSRELLAS